MLRSALFAALAVAAAAPALAADNDTYRLALQDHRFVPDRLEVPAGRKLVLMVANRDATAEEFDSHDLRREKVVGPGQEVRILVGPLEPGEYHFAGEYNESTAQGVLVAQ